MHNSQAKIFYISFVSHIIIYVFSAMRKAKTGRKRLPEAEKTVSVVFYTKRAIVDKAGGMQAARERAKELLETALQQPVAA